MKALEVLKMIERETLIDIGSAYERSRRNAEKVDLVVSVFEVFAKCEWASLPYHKLSVGFHEGGLAIFIDLGLLDDIFFEGLIRCLSEAGLDCLYGTSEEVVCSGLQVFEGGSNHSDPETAPKRVDVIFI